MLNILRKTAGLQFLHGILEEGSDMKGRPGIIANILHHAKSRKGLRNTQSAGRNVAGSRRKRYFLFDI